MISDILLNTLKGNHDFLVVLLVSCKRKVRHHRKKVTKIHKNHSMDFFFLRDGSFTNCFMLNEKYILHLVEVTVSPTSENNKTPIS